MHTVTYILQSILWPFMYLTRLLGRFHVIGVENLAKVHNGRGVILVSNHRTQLDPIFLAAAFPFFSQLRPLYYVSRPSGGYTHLRLGFLFGGFLFKIWGAYPVYRGLKDYRLSLRNPLRLLGERKTVCIFPEGGIPDTPGFGPAHSGVRYLAEYSGATILPTAITYSKEKGYVVAFGEPSHWKGETPQEIFDRTITVHTTHL